MYIFTPLYESISNFPVLYVSNNEPSNSTVPTP